MKFKIGILLFVFTCGLAGCRQPANLSNANSSNSNAAKTTVVNTNALEIKREDLKTETEKLKKNLEQSPRKSDDPKVKSGEMHEKLRETQKETNKSDNKPQ